MRTWQSFQQWRACKACKCTTQWPIWQVNIDDARHNALITPLLAAAMYRGVLLVCDRANHTRTCSDDECRGAVLVSVVDIRPALQK